MLSPFWLTCPKPNKLNLRLILEPVGFDDGAVIIRDGEKSKAMYFVVRGKVGVYKGASGRARVFLRTIPVGGHFGEMGLLCSGAHSAFVHANGKCALLKLTDEAFKKILKSPQLAAPFLLRLAQTLAFRLDNVSVRYGQMSSFLS